MTEDRAGWIRLSWGPTGRFESHTTHVVLNMVDHGSIRAAVDEAATRLIESMALDYAINKSKED